MATDGFSFCSSSSSTAYDVDEAMSTSSRKSPSMGKERDWWSADLEGEMEELEVEGSFSVAEGGSMDPERKGGPLVNSEGADHWSTRRVLTKEESEGVRLAETKERK